MTSLHDLTTCAHCGGPLGRVFYVLHTSVVIDSEGAGPQPAVHQYVEVPLCRSCYHGRGLDLPQLVGRVNEQETAAVPVVPAEAVTS